ncbi:MAG: PspC domain-containing protein [Bulleidia sp.]
MRNRKLYRSIDQRIVSGVCGGVGEYFDIDPNVVRLAFLMFCAMGGSGFIVYLLAAILIPEEPY